MRIRGSVVVVTGASAGIGRETAILLARRGARVWAVARSEAALERLAGEHPNVVPFAADLTDDQARAALVDTVGAVDVLVNNAGIGWTGLVEEMSAEEVRRLFEINVFALVDLTQRVLPGMLERRRGHICNVASVASWVATPPITMYSATKFAVQGFSDGLRREVRGRGVTVSTVNPGPVDTTFARRAIVGDRPTEQLGEHGMPGVPPQWVARAVARAVRMGGVPGWTTVAVPRALGLGRVGAVPGVQLAVDVACLFTRRAGVRLRRRAAPVPSDTD
ncbi:MAG TPA: SDR family NAD(P)-dependent oxidoreductase [Acidimicrobiales bacterium]|nr:SDR family NAD(P)-dependent oxidoreductase [Acidimicrobiales bacterium]